MTDMLPVNYQKSYSYRKNDTDPPTNVTNANPIFGQSFDTAEYSDGSNKCGTDLLNN